MSSRREFLARAAALAAGPAAALALGSRPAGSGEAPENRPAEEKKALVAITLDLEMSRNFPTWDRTEWDYEKGNLDPDTKRYAAAAARRVRERGGRIHFFAVGRVFEQEDVSWLEEIVRAGHPGGNHTYDHVNVKATEPADLQFRFRRAPWLIEGKTPRQVIAENIRLTTRALKTRLGISPAGFRTPGGFANGLEDREDLQALLLEEGFRWVSSRYPAHPLPAAGEEPGPAFFKALAEVQAGAQPFRYPSGLVEVPMSPISDITAFRAGRFKLGTFLAALRAGVEWTIEHRAVFDFLGHPSCLLATDPGFRALDLLCDLVEKAGRRAAHADLDGLARRAEAREP